MAQKLIITNTNCKKWHTTKLYMLVHGFIQSLVLSKECIVPDDLVNIIFQFYPKIGLLIVNIIKCIGIPNYKLGFDILVPNPFTEIIIKDALKQESETQSTSVVLRNNNPIWNDVLKFKTISFYHYFRLTVRTWNASQRKWLLYMYDDIQIKDLFNISKSIIPLNSATTLEENSKIQLFASISYSPTI
eukprot:364795_1